VCRIRRTGSGGFPEGFEAQINSTHKDPNKTGSLFVTGQTRAIVASQTGRRNPTNGSRGSHRGRPENHHQGQRQDDREYTDAQSQFAKGQLALQFRRQDHREFPQNRDQGITDDGPAAKASHATGSSARSFAGSLGLRFGVVDLSA